MFEKRPLLFFFLLLIMATLACTVPGIKPSGPVATPTPVGDTLSFTNPAYATSLAPGEFVLGTQMQYVKREGDNFKVTIDGLEATKRIGDSFIWNGVLAPGVYGNYNLRLTTVILGDLPVAGSVEVTVFYPAPVQLETLPDLSEALTFNNTVINYLIPEGRQIPGTTLTYDAMVEQGQGDQVTRQAQLSGLSGYPLLAVGDSLQWQGSLLNNVTIRYNLRVLGISEDGLRLTGTADLWVTQ
ncbi:MAG: hypothetical protein H6662_13825 [Ardenticatenaceae bacterium]|nr:hypothetical protein [Anaerolineales bacterium]MCB8922661.1 hypothetical protein [Ardenticatenaceae bacterium]MCB9003631.1 hypothetical protein [Ardenticatenaceae bacterium]